MLAWAGLTRGDDKAPEKKWHLEFRILANAKDDAKALEAASKYFAEAREDAKRKAELQKLAEEGKPPDPLKVATDKAPGYGWLEVGDVELRSLHLAEGEKSDEAWDAFRKEVAGAREKGEPIVLKRFLEECLLYSRNCQSTKLSKEEREKKKVEYFLLMRDPEKDKAVTGEYLVEVKADEVFNGPAIQFRLSKKGGDLFHELTSKNRPDKNGEYRRHLAIILDGKIMTAPAIHQPISTNGVISGRFTRAEVDAIVEILRSDLSKDKK
jgi:hypothetical protein